jgi:aryl-alcohol dehydrogenase-like predicted oxidoreductase
MPKIGLGCAGLGTQYGNAHKRMSKEAAFNILDTALVSNIQFYDTAPDYGMSEEILGEWQISRKASVEIVTKIPKTHICEEKTYKAFVKEQIEKSMYRLKRRKFTLIQFHQSDIGFLSSHYFHRTVDWLLDERYTTAIGVSVYSPDEALCALEVPQVSAIQCPVNILDRRFVEPKMLALFRERKIRLIARSIFLQGVLIETAKLPICKREKELRELKRLCRVAACCALQSLRKMSYSYVAGIDAIDVGIIGANTVRELEETIRLSEIFLEVPAKKALEVFDLAREYANEKELFDPRTWNAP